MKKMSLIYNKFNQNGSNWIILDQIGMSINHKTHHLEISYYVNFLGSFDSNGFQLK